MVFLWLLAVAGFVYYAYNTYSGLFFAIFLYINNLLKVIPVVPFIDTEAVGLIPSPLSSEIFLSDLYCREGFLAVEGIFTVTKSLKKLSETPFETILLKLLITRRILFSMAFFSSS